LSSVRIYSHRCFRWRWLGAFCRIEICLVNVIIRRALLVQISTQPSQRVLYCFSITFLENHKCEAVFKTLDFLSHRVELPFLNRSSIRQPGTPSLTKELSIGLPFRQRLLIIQRSRRNDHSIFPFRVLDEYVRAAVTTEITLDETTSIGARIIVLFQGTRRTSNIKFLFQ